ncbi:MAG TPA: hypothetical protein VGO93_08070 [Candidatus Xenobia bacterium]|jgi:hypothetical protein
MLTRALLAGAVLLTSFAAPALAKSPKPLVSKNVAVSDTVTRLEQAKKTLQTDTTKDTGEHKAHALADIEKAMQELRAITQGSKH